MGGSNLPQAFPNYLICLRFIRISTVVHAYQPSSINILGEGGATLSFNSCPVGGADHCGHGDI